MNPDAHTPSPVPEGPGHDKATAKRPARRSGSGQYFTEYFVLLPALFLAIDLVTSLVRAFRDRELEITLEFTADAAAAAVTQGAAIDLRGMAEVSIPFGDLAGVTIGMLLAAKVVLVVGLTLGSWWAGGVINQIGQGRAFTDQAIIDLGRIFWTGLVTILVYGGLLLLGSNLVTRDLGISDHVNNGVDNLSMFTAIAILGIVEIVRYAFRRGKAAQDELEGLV